MLPAQFPRPCRDCAVPRALGARGCGSSARGAPSGRGNAPQRGRTPTWQSGLGTGVFCLQGRGERRERPRPTRTCRTGPGTGALRGAGNCAPTHSGTAGQQHPPATPHRTPCRISRGLTPYRCLNAVLKALADENPDAYARSVIVMCSQLPALEAIPRQVATAPHGSAPGAWSPPAATPAGSGAATSPSARAMDVPVSAGSAACSRT